MNVGLIIVATEILEGKIKDLNGPFLSQYLKNYQLELKKTLVVRDILSEIVDALDYFKNYEMIIVSGGLGPTQDDLTKEALSTFLKKPIVYSEKAHQISHENYQRMKRDYPGKDHPYSFLPEQVHALPNQTGFAPGLKFENKNQIILCAQGVPREFISTIEDHLTPWIKLNFRPNIFMENLVFRTKKIPEEKIFNEVDQNLWPTLSSFGDVSSLPVLMGVDIGIKIKAPTKENLLEKIAEVKSIIQRSPVSKYIWADEFISLEEKIITLAQKKNIRFSFAESCTGGLCSHRITNISGSSQVFMGSVVCYDESVKEHILKVSSETMKSFGVVSSQTAEEMAKGSAEYLQTPIALSLTGLAGPSGGSDTIPVGTLFLGFSYFGQVSSEKFQFQGSREVLKERFAQAALYKLLELLLET